jgi:ribonuclease Z
MEFTFLGTSAGTPDFCWQDQDFGVTNVALSHRVPCRAYVFTERNIERQLLQDKLKQDGIEPGQRNHRQVALQPVPTGASASLI